MNNKNDKEFDVVVYEPVKRGENDLIDKEKEDLLKCKKYCGLYNRGK